MIITKDELFKHIKNKGGVTLIDGYFRVGSRRFIEYLKLALEMDNEVSCMAYNGDVIVKETEYNRLVTIKGKKLELKSDHSYCVIFDKAWVGKKSIVDNFLTLGVLNT